MLFRRASKRRRTEAFSDQEQLKQAPEGEEQNEGAHDDHQGDVNDGPVDQQHADQETVAPERSQKEQEIWDAFKEEQYEVLEQLPLSLHRSLTLMHELDQQVHAHEDQLLSNLRSYIALRKRLERAYSVESRPLTDQDRFNGSLSVEAAQANPSESQNGDESQPAPEVAAGPTALQKGVHTAASPSNPSIVDAAQESESSRRLLIQVAQLSDEIGRATLEKVNVAQFTCDLVDRYIRHMDRAIKEQETSIQLGLRPGTHLASIILPEVVVPAGLRAPRVVPEPLSVLADAASTTGAVDGPEAARAPEAPAPAAGPGETTVGMISEDAHVSASVQGGSVRPRRKGRAKWSKKKKMVRPLEGDENTNVEVPATSSGLKLTVPPLSAVATNVEEVPVDPNEERWCYCHQVSFGEMIACDNDGCTREWFHLGCVGLAQAPPKRTKWYCRECQEIIDSRKQRR